MASSPILMISKYAVKVILYNFLLHFIALFDFNLQNNLQKNIGSMLLKVKFDKRYLLLIFKTPCKSSLSKRLKLQPYSNLTQFNLTWPILELQECSMIKFYWDWGIGGEASVTRWNSKFLYSQFSIYVEAWG